MGTISQELSRAESPLMLLSAPQTLFLEVANPSFLQCPGGGAAGFLQGSATRRARSRPLCCWKQPGLARSPHPRDAEDRGSSVPAVGGSAARWERGGEQRSRAGAGEEQGGFELPQARFRCWLDWGAKLLRGWERHLLLFIL